MSEHSSNELNAPRSEEILPLEVQLERGALITDLDTIRNQLEAAEHAGDLPDGARIHRYGQGKTQVLLGTHDADFGKALADRREAPDPAKPIVITFDDLERSTASSDAPRHTEMQRITTGTEYEGTGAEADMTVEETSHIVIHTDGGIQKVTEKVGVRREHPDDASDLVKAYATPTQVSRHIIHGSLGRQPSAKELHDFRLDLRTEVLRYGIELPL